MPPNERPAAQLPRILAGEGKPYDKVMSYVLLIPVDQDLDQRTLMREIVADVLKRNQVPADDRMLDAITLRQ